MRNYRDIVVFTFIILCMGSGIWFAGAALLGDQTYSILSALLITVGATTGTFYRFLNGN